MPWAWRWPRSCWRPNSTAPGTTLVDHRTYAFLGDGCLMEGISHEVVFAGRHAAPVASWWRCTTTTASRSTATWKAGSPTTRRRASAPTAGTSSAPSTATTATAVDRALAAARAQGDDPAGKPTLIVCRTVIGQGAPTKAGGHDVHGAPLGATELAGAARRAGLDLGAVRGAGSLACGLGRPRARCRAAVRLGRAAGPPTAPNIRRWRPNSSAAWPATCRRTSTPTWRRRWSGWPSSAAAVATRKASQLALDALAPALPELFGGSADLTGSQPHQFQGLHRGRP